MCFRNLISRENNACETLENTVDIEHHLPRMLAIWLHYFILIILSVTTYTDYRGKLKLHYFKGNIK